MSSRLDEGVGDTFVSAKLRPTHRTIDTFTDGFRAVILQGQIETCLAKARSLHFRYPNMHIAILTFQGFNELDSFVALAILNRVKKPGWRVTLCCPEAEVTSMNGVTVRAQSLLEEARDAGAVIVGSGVQTRTIAGTPAMLDRLRLDPGRQLIAAQCSGTLLLAKLGLLGDAPACTDVTTKPWVQEAGVEVLNQPFFARDNIATAGGCLASSYLAAWIIARSEGVEAAAAALRYVAPVGEKEAFLKNALDRITPYLPAAAIAPGVGATV